jgi:hypothetical protein
MSRLFRVIKIAALSYIGISGWAFSDILKTDPTVDGYAVQIQDDIFKFDSRGVLIEGPVRGSGDPIDYSSILKEAYLKLGFFQSVLGCFDENDDCRDVSRRFNKRALHLSGSQESGVISSHDFSEISRVGQNTLGALGFDVEAVPNHDMADILIVVGSKSYLLEKMKDHKDFLGIDRLSYWGELRLSDKADPGFCYVSEREWDSRGDIYIYFDKEGISECLPGSFLNAIGLGSTWLEIPSVTDISEQFTSATFADVLYGRLLYHESFPIEGDLSDIANFWEDFAPPKWQNLVEQDLKN